MNTITLPATLLKSFGALIPSKQVPYSTTYVLINPRSKEMFVSNGCYICRANLEFLELPTDSYEDQKIQIDMQQIKIALLKNPKGVVACEYILVDEKDVPAVKLVYESLVTEENYGSPCTCAYFDPKYTSTITKAFSCMGQDMKIEFPNDDSHCLKFTIVYNDIECIALLMPRKQ